MLINFKVSNFTSFDKLQEVSLVAGKVRTHSQRVYTENRNKLLKFIAIYGANASGKSNLVSAFEFAKSLIVEGFSGKGTDLYCKLDDNNKKTPSHFEFTLIVNGKRYNYGFEVILFSQTLQSEWLYELKSGGNHRVVFERDITNSEFIVNTYFKEASINERLAIYADDIRNDASVLFITLMNKNKDALYESNSEIKLYRNLYNWFKFKLSVNFSDRPVTNYSYLLNDERVEEISKLLSDFGTGISKFDLVDISLDKIAGEIPKEVLKEIIDDLLEQQKHFDKKGINRTPAIMVRGFDNNTIFILRLSGEDVSAQTLMFNHQNTTATFSLNEESDGTIRLLDLVEILLSDANEKVYIIDEINRRFHPLLTQKFIQEYLRLAEERNIQLIVTTHESKIMDLKLLRKDEIGFVDKSETGDSNFFTMDNFGERFDKRVCLAYFNGEYGAIPKFK